MAAEVAVPKALKRATPWRYAMKSILVAALLATAVLAVPVVAADHAYPDASDCLSTLIIKDPVSCVLGQYYNIHDGVRCGTGQHHYCH